MNKDLLRIISASIALAFLIGSYFFFERLGLKIFITLLSLIAAFEYACMILFQNKKRNYFVLICFILLCQIELHYVYVHLYLQPFYEFGDLLFIFLWVSLIFYQLYKKSEDAHQVLYFIFALVFGVVYLGHLPSHIMEMLNLNIDLFFTFCAIIFTGDTAAYVFGKFWGKKKILPHISPQKTWVGCFAGLCGSGIAAIVCYNFFSLQVRHYLLFIFICIICGFIGQLGDFFESLLKRSVGVKNSGYIMPGHGGVLDRIDGLLFAAPVFITCWFILLR